MRLNHVIVENYGPIEQVELSLDPQFNVIAGVNGAGKSTLLNATWVMLSRYISAVRTGRAVGPFPSNSIRKSAKEMRVEVGAQDGKEAFRWAGGRRRLIQRGATPLTDSKQLIDYAYRLVERMEVDPATTSIPIVVAFSVNRAVLDIPLRVRGKVPFEQFDALEDAAAQTNRNFRKFFAWFRDREDLENEKRIKSGRYRDPQLQAVREAIEGLLPGFRDLRVKRSPLRMVITKGEQDLQVDQLSDGEKSLLALAGDLARRLAVANPGAKRPLDGSGIVLIDELELHLHPRWQRRIVRQLQTIFPQCQFIVTTHSPQVLSEARPEQVYLLSQGQVTRPIHSYGREVGLILEELMDTPARPDWVAETLEQLYVEIEEDEFEAARKSYDKLAAKLGDMDPGLTAARLVLKPKVKTSS